MGHRVLDLIERDPSTVSRRWNARARRLAAGTASGARASHGCAYAVVQLESIVDFTFRAGRAEPQLRRRARADEAAYAAFYHAMRDRGVLLAPSQNEVMFLSTAHTDADIDETIAAVDASFGDLRAAAYSAAHEATR